MALSSMTGFARGHGVSGSYAWAWEIKSVNGKGLDMRLRMPPGWDAIEVPVRARAAEALTRGSVQANLTVERSGAAPVVRVNTAVLDAILATMRQLASKIEASPPSLDGLLALKGVIEVGDSEEREDERRSAETAVTAGFGDGDRRARRDAPSRRRGARPCAVGAARLKSRRLRSAPSSRPAASPKRSGRGLPNRSRRCSRSPSASIPIGCIRKRS